MSNAIGLEERELIERLQPWLQRQLPDAERVKVVSVKLPDNGASNLTGVMDVEWLQQGVARRQRLILRTVSAQADQLYEQYDLGKQYRIMACLAGTAVKVPHLLARETDVALLGRDFYVMYDTGGRSIAENPPYHLSGWFAEISAADRRSIWMQGVDSIAQIHQLDWQALGLGFLEPPEFAQDKHQAFVARHSQLLHWMERRNNKSYPRLRRIYDWLEANFPKDTPSGLIWADAKLGNLMIEGAEVVGVLDWEHCTLGPFLYDLANWMIFDRMMSEGLGAPRLPGMPERDETIRRWETATGLSAKGVEFFELFSAVRLCNVILGLAPKLIAAGIVKDDFEHNNSATVILEKQLQFMGLAL